MPRGVGRRIAVLTAACSVSLAVLVSVAAAAPAGSDPTPAADPGDAGLLALDAGDFEAARPLLARAVERAPEDPSLHHALGLASLGLGRDVAALSALERAAELDPALPGVQADLGLTLYRIGERDRAEVHLVEALVQGPENADVLMHLGLLDAEHGEHARALRMFEEAAAVEPDRAAAAWYEAAGVRLALDDVEGATESLERAVASAGPEPARQNALALLVALRRGAPRRVALSAGAGVEYDDNVTVSAIDTTTGQGDVAAVLDAGVELWAIRQATAELSAGYDFYQSLYRTLTAFDLQSHSPFIRAAAGEGPVWGFASYRYTNDSLGGVGFLSTHRVEVGIEVAAAPWLVALAGARFEDLDFDRSPRRTSTRAALEVAARLLHPQHPMSLGIGWQPVWSDARGREFDYRAQIISTGADVAVPLGDRAIDLRATYDWESRDYQNVTFRIRARRWDVRHVFGAGLSTGLVGPTTVSLDYLFVSSSSNLPELNYDENIVTLRLGVFD